MFSKSSSNKQNSNKGNTPPQPTYQNPPVSDTGSGTSDFSQNQPLPESTGNYKSSNMDTTSSSSSKPSFISEEAVLTGNIKTSGALHIEGKVIGDLDVAHLTISSAGTFEGNANCKVLNIRGRFTGKSVCRELRVASSAQIDANVTYQDLTLQRGAGLRGELRVANFVE